jgi:hypothetical protein
MRFKKLFEISNVKKEILNKDKNLFMQYNSDDKDAEEFSKVYKKFFNDYLSKKKSFSDKSELRKYGIEEISREKENYYQNGENLNDKTYYTTKNGEFVVIGNGSAKDGGYTSANHLILSR